MDPLISRLDQTNYQAAFTIQQSCHFNPWSESVFADSLNEPYFAYQLMVAEQPIGYYVGLLVLNEVTLMDIGLAEIHRGKGYGHMLIRHFLQQCYDRSGTEVWLEVRESNKTAIGLYHSYGFDQIEVRKNYYPITKGREDGLILKKSL